MNTLVHPILGSINLPIGLIWEDLLKVNSHRTNESYSINGAFHMLAGKILAGGRISLKGGEDYGFIQGGALASLQAFSEDRKPMVLNYSGVNYNVFFDYSAGAIEFNKVQLLSTNSTADYYNNVVLNFVRV